MYVPILVKNKNDIYLSLKKELEINRSVPASDLFLSVRFLTHSTGLFLF